MHRLTLVAWIGAISMLGCTLGILSAQSTPSTGSSTSQPDPRLLRPRSALQSGIELYMKAEYEKAESYLRTAEQGKQQLTPTEQSRLDDYLAKNLDALKGRLQAQEDLQMVEQLVKDGHHQEAEPFIKSLRANKYLTSGERQRVNGFNEQAKQTIVKRGPVARPPVEPMESAAPPAATVPAKDADALFADARRAFEAKDYDQAETLAREADRAGFKPGMFLWSDSPAKLLKEIQTARAKSGGNRPVAGDAKTANARELLRQAHVAVQAGDVASAKRLVREAEEQRPQIAWYEPYTVEKVKNEIARVELAMAPNGVQQASALTPPVKDGPTQPPTTTPSAERPVGPTEARLLVKEARRLLDEHKLDEAEANAKKARLVTVKWSLFEDTPDKVLADVLKARESHNGDKAAALLAEARAKMEQNQFDEAEKLTYQAEALRSSYPLWHRGERHDRLRAEIASKRKSFVKPELPPLLDTVVKKNEEQKPQGARPAVADVRSTKPMPPSQPTMTPPPAMPPATAANAGTMMPPAPPATVANAGAAMPTPPAPAMPAPPAGDATRQEALQMLAQARGSMSRGEIPQALQLAARVKTMGFVPKPGDDSPEAVVQAVSALQQKQAADRQAAETANAAKAKAAQCLVQARAYQREGRLLEAMQAIQEARQCRATFAANDETPDVVLADLKVAAHKQLETYLGAAQTLADARSFAEATRYLGYVKQLATVYELDATPVDEKFQQVASMAQAAAPATAVASSDGDGQRLAEEVRVELERGDLVKARKLAESLYVGPFAMKDVAKSLLAQIDDAEYQQSVKRAHLLYEQGVRAYSRKDFAVAASYFQGIDMRLLDERQRVHAQEIMSSRDMLPSAIIQAAKTDDAPSAPATVTVTDQEPKSPGGLLSEVQQRQSIELQRLREQQLSAQREANRLSKQGDMNGAIQVIENALAAVQSSGLDSDQTAAMQRQLQERLKQYNVQREQLAYADMQKAKLDANSQVAANRYKFEERKKELVAGFMRQYKAYMNEGKYKEAAAVAMKAKEVDPDDPVVDAALYKAEITKSLNSERDVTLASQSGVSKAFREVGESAVPNTSGDHPLDMPSKQRWDEITNKRAGKTSYKVKPESPEDLATLRRLEKHVSVSFQDKPLREVIDEFRALADVNLTLDTVNINLDGVMLDQPITEQLSNLPAKTVLKLLLSKARLTYVINDGVVLVTTPLGQRGKEIRIVYPVADLVTAQSIANGTASQLVARPTSGAYGQAFTPAGMQWETSGPTGDGGYVPGGGQPKGQQSRRPGQSMEDLLMKLIIDTIEPGSWDHMGGSGHVDYYPLGMSLVVNQTPDIQEQVGQLLDRLRELQMVQVAVECRFITLSETFYERIGVDFDININTNQTKFGRQVVTSAFAPVDQPNAPSHVGSVTVGMTQAGNFTTDLDVPIRSSSFELSALPTGFANFPGATTGNGGIDMGVAFLSSIETFLFIEAVQGDVRSNVLTAPRLTLFNGQQANINTSVTDFFVLDVAAVRDPLTGLITFVPQTSPLPSSIDLTLSAVISADRRYVKLNLVPFISRVIDSGQTFSPVAGVTLQQPTIETISVSTSVSVPDGGTILVGGLKRLTEQRREFGPPILSKIPYVNRLYRNQSFGRDATNLIIMVTPRIIIHEEEEERLGQTFAF